MKKIIDLTGKTFGRLTVEGQEGYRDQRGRVVWRLACECGNKVFYEAGRFKYGNTTSCGCYKKELVGNEHRSHGLSKTPTYSSWLTMKKRCYNKKCSDYADYGARGITVCERWMTFENFYADMGERPKGLTLDRINCNDGYKPENCRWATASQQARNKRNSRLVTFNGCTKSIYDFCEELMLNRYTVLTRLQKNWPIERALTVPTGRFANV